MDENQQPGDEVPQDAHASNGAAVENAGAADEAEASAPAAPAKPSKSTLESWMEAAAAAEKKKPVPTGEKKWYILKVQSNREDSIRDALLRRIRIQGLSDFFGDIVVPIEKVIEFKNGKKRTVKRKLYPGYIVVHMELNDDTWFLIRETGGIGDFTQSGGKPVPMDEREVKKILQKPEEEEQEQQKIAFPHKKGDRVKVNEGMFENHEGEVDSIDMSNGRVTVLINIFGRPVPVELEHWQLEIL
ncbi:MAG: transcription termination/antitermination factor NusG [Planctomycetes bacterium]|nr:transcription termination/antitermination factor NusG [Planctomycetota bacterium]